jgi:SAM-dependent methyltransferase
LKRLPKQDIEEHNLSQIRYFEQPTQPNMVPTNSPYIQRHVDEVLRFAGISPGERVLEVGCGMGRYTFVLAQRGVEVEGLDLSPFLLRQLREYDSGRYNIPLHHADIFNHPPELEGRFEAVVGFFTLHHLHDLPQCFGAMRRLLKPGGRVVFLEPNPYNLLYYIQILTMPHMSWQGDKGIVHMRSGPIFRAMQIAGLHRPTMARFGFFPPFLTNQQWGSRVEAALERLPILRPFLPFQLFRGELP